MWSEEELQRIFDSAYHKFGGFFGICTKVEEFDEDVRKFAFGFMLSHEFIIENQSCVTDFTEDMAAFCAGVVAGAQGSHTRVGVRSPWKVSFDDSDGHVTIKFSGRFKFYTPESENEK